MSSTRQATPGPSNASQITLRNRNTNKRVLSDDDEDVGKDVKRMKQENGDKAEHGGRDKKRRRKRKRKTPIVTESVRLPQAGRTRRAPVLKDANLMSALAVETSVDGKGKARAVPEFHAEPQPSCSESPADTVIRLTEQLAAKTQLVKKHEDLLTQLQQSVTCQICMDLMFKPYALAPCGHLACYNCIVQWFTVPRTEGPVQPVHLREKTCPHCRAVIKDPPVAVWGVRGIAAGLSKSGLLPGANTALIPFRKDGTVNEDESGQMPVDPWSNLFPRTPHHQNPGDAAPEHDWGFLDVEDGGIYRCVDCMHEIWGGLCSACGRVYNGHGDLESGDEEDWNDQHENFVPFAPWLPVYYPPFPGLFFPVNNGQDQNMEEEGYESSFIDDTDHNPSFNTVRPFLERMAADSSSDSEEDIPHAQIVEVDSDDVDILGHEEEEGEGEEDERDDRRRQRSLRTGSAPLRTRPIVLSDDDESDHSSCEDRPISARVLRRRVVSSDDEDTCEPESGDDDSEIDTDESASEEYDSYSEDEHISHFRFEFPQRRTSRRR